MPPQVMFRQEPEVTDGLRSRKKIKTRLAIEDAALELFAEQGYEATTIEQIAERAEVSTTTFFRYFPGKADVVLSDQKSRLPALRQAILDRPSAENDFVAVKRALLQAWVAVIDPERTALTSLVVTSAPLLRGLSYDIGQRWLYAISDALAQRHGVVPHRGHLLTARTTLAVFGDAIEAWIEDGCRDDLEKIIEWNFDTMKQLCHEWSQG
jgi:AcrR family transcriptional regulator